jgi:small-conductance mechanosensitive channel
MIVMKPLLPNPWLLGFGITLLSYVLIYVLKRLLCTRLSKLVGKNGNKWDDIVVHTLEHTTHLFMLATAVYLAFRFVPHDWHLNRLFNRTYFIVLMMQTAIWMNFLINRLVTSFINRKVRKNPAAATSISLIQLVGKLCALSILLLFTLHNLGINITTILAGFGVGGIAVALALQKILGDLFSSLSIVMDKPFVVGDFIIIDQYMGEVEKIGLKTTRIRSLGGEQIIISNSDILGSRIRNYKRLRERRISLQTGLPHATSPDDVRKAVSLIQAIVRSKDRVRFERCHLQSIASHYLNIETIYWVLSDDYDLHMDIQQSILLDVLTAFKAEGLALAVPTQKVHIEPREFFMRTDLTQANEASQNARSIS